MVFTVGTASVSLFDQSTEFNATTDLNTSMLAYANGPNGVHTEDDLVSVAFQDGNPLIIDKAKCVASASKAHWCNVEGTINTDLFGALADIAYNDPIPFAITIADALSIISSNSSDIQLTMIIVDGLNNEFAAMTNNTGFIATPTYAELSFSEVITENIDGTFSSILKWSLAEVF